MDTPGEEELQNDLESHEESQDYSANETPHETLMLGAKFGLVYCPALSYVKLTCRN